VYSGALWSNYYQINKAKRTKLWIFFEYLFLPLKTKPKDPCLFQLETLDLSGNQLFSVGAEAFADLPNLERLELNGNELKEVPDVAIEAVGADLRRLGLARNKLEAIKEEDFQGMNHLEELDLSGNGGLSLTTTSFSSLRDSLLRLDLSSLGLTSWEDISPALAPLERLEVLLLNGNYFKVKNKPFPCFFFRYKFFMNGY